MDAPILMDLTLKRIQKIFNEFSDLVLGVPPKANKSGPSLKKRFEKVYVSRYEDFSAMREQMAGGIVEVLAHEPEEIDRFLSDLLAEPLPIAVLGAELAGSKANLRNRSAFWLDSSQASQIMFAAKELSETNAIEKIVIVEMLLKFDVYDGNQGGPFELMKMLRLIHKKLHKKKSTVVLINPNTPERGLVRHELESICSFVFELKRYGVCEEV